MDLRGRSALVCLTHWGWVTHICVNQLNFIDLDNGLLPGRRQAITWVNAGILLIRLLGTKFSEISIEDHIFSFKKCIWICRLRNAIHFSRFQCIKNISRKYAHSFSVPPFVGVILYPQALMIHVVFLRTLFMMTSSNGNIFRVTGHLCGEFTGRRWIPGALMFSLICVQINGWVNNRKAGDLRRYRTHYVVIVMSKLLHWKMVGCMTVPLPMK